MRDLKKGDAVVHKSNRNLVMVVISFENYWPGEPERKDENIAAPYCRYYNTYTNEWEEKAFNAFELILVSKD